MSFVKGLGVDLIGIADLYSLRGMPIGISSDAASFLSHYQSAIVMGAQLGKLGKSAKGTELSLFPESMALAVVDRLERKGHRVLIVHTENETIQDYKYLQTAIGKDLTYKTYI